MRFNANSNSEWAAVRRERSHFLVVLVACAIGATTSAAVILSLGDFPFTQTGVPPISPSAIVRNVVTFESSKGSQGSPNESPLQSAMPITVSGHDQPVTQSEAEHQGEVHSQQSQHRQQHSREPHRQRRFAYGFWRSTRFSSPRDELTSGTR